MVMISTEELRVLCVKALRATDMRERDIEITVDHFLENEMSGKTSHGIVRIVEVVRTLKKWPVPKSDPEIEKDDGNVLLMNANGQLGTVAGWHLLQAALERGKDHSLCLVGIHNYICNSGSMAYYLRRLTKAGLIGMISCNSVALVAPPNGKKRMLGTNPVGFGIPGENGDEFILDMATSAIAYGKVMVLNDQGKSVPENALIDKDGRMTTNPSNVYEGAILPLADYRGFGLGLMMELLAGPMIGGKAIKDELYQDDGFFMLVMNPKRISGDAFYSSVSETLQKIRTSPPRQDAKHVRLPGDRSKEKLQDRLKTGHLEVTDQTLKNLKDAAGA